MLLGKNRINEIKGPFRMDVLRSNDNPGSTMILFGETHTLEHYSPCDTENCISMVTNFVPMLNDFAATYPTELYTEAFFPNLDSATIADNFQDAHINRKIMQYKQYRINDQESYNHPKSIMNEFNGLYSYCFYPVYKHKCEYKNISWNYADPRDTDIYGFDTLTQTHTSYISMIDSFNVIKKRGTVDNSEIIESFSGIHDITTPILMQCKETFEIEMKNVYTTLFDLPDLFRKYIVVLNDVNRFVDELLRSPIIGHQYESLTPELKLIFTRESFIQLATKWKRNTVYPENCKRVLTVLLEKLIEFYESDDAIRKDEIAAIINGYTYTELELSFIRNAPTAQLGCTLDIYFILRSNKRGPQNKLVVGYFGSNHYNEISYYFTDIIRTHRLLARENGQGKITMSREIDLRYLTQALVAGTKRRKRTKRTKKKRN